MLLFTGFCAGKVPAFKKITCPDAKNGAGKRSFFAVEGHGGKNRKEGKK